MILSEKPDIVQFQEFSPQMQDKIKTLRSIFPYSTELNKPKGPYDSLILSKYPLTNTKVEDNHVVITNLILNEAEISIVGIHLLPGGTKENFNYALQQINYWWSAAVLYFAFLEKVLGMRNLCSCLYYIYNRYFIIL